MSDKEHTAAALGHSEELSVKHSVGETIPEVSQRPEEGAERCPLVLGKYAWHVLPEKPARAKLSHSSDVFEHEATSRIHESAALTRDAEGLAGASPDHKVN